MRGSKLILCLLLSFVIQTAFAQSVVCSFGVARIDKDKNGIGLNKLRFGQSNPEYIDKEPHILLNFEEGTYTNFNGPGGAYTLQRQYMKFKDAYILLVDLPTKIRPESNNGQSTLVYFPGSKTVVELSRYLSAQELKLEQAGKSPHLQKKEAIARIDPNLVIEIAPCRDATEEEIDVASHAGPPDPDLGD